MFSYWGNIKRSIMVISECENALNILGYKY